MSSQIVTKSVEVVCGQERRAGEIEVTEFDSRERMRRATKIAIICLLSISVSVFIPGAHFVLVPLLIVITPFLIFRAYNVGSAITDMSIVCAQCGGEVSSVSTRERYPLYETCVVCHRENRIVLAPVSN